MTMSIELVGFNLMFYIFWWVEYLITNVPKKGQKCALHEGEEGGKSTNLLVHILTYELTILVLLLCSKWSYLGNMFSHIRPFLTYLVVSTKYLPT